MEIGPALAASFLSDSLSMSAAFGRDATGIPTRAQGYLNTDERGGVADNGKASLTIDQAASRLTGDEAGWGGVLGRAANVTYAFRSTQPSTMPDDTAGFSRFTEAQIIQAEKALLAWSDVANITFTRVGEGTTGEAAYSNSASILFADYASGNEGAAAFANYPGSRNSASAAGDVWVNSSESYNTSPSGTNYGGLTIVHEIGHAIGLSHPSDYDAEKGVTITYSADASYFEDSRQYTVMSYFGGFNTGADLPAYSSTPLLDDIAAAQQEYGANMTTRTGDTVYGFNSTADRPWFALTSNSSVAQFAVWDAGGRDTLDFSGYSDDQKIDLRQGFFSDVGGWRGNVAVAKNVDIENAIGGSGDDSITGNSLANDLRGGGGDDTVMGGAGGDTLFGGPGDDQLDGGEGLDTAAYAASRAHVMVSYAAGAYHVVDLTAASAGSDMLSSIETVSFSGVVIAAERGLLATVASLGDYNRDGRTDILWRDQSNGATALWEMTATHNSGGGVTDGYAGTGWILVGSGDFNGDGAADLLWRAADSGQTLAWMQHGPHLLSAGLTGAQAGHEWFVSGLADFDGDGRTDLLWRNFDSGATVIWTLDGLAVTTSRFTDVSAPNAWSVAGSGDFNGDGKADLLWRNQGDGSTFVWLMDGAHVTGGGFTSAYAPRPWTVASVNDFNADGRADVLWRNIQSGDTVIWTMDGAAQVGGGLTSLSAPLDWSVAGTGDFGGDGRADILWRNDATGATTIWQMSAQNVLAAGFTDAFAPLGWAFT